MRRAVPYWVVYLALVAVLVGATFLIPDSGVSVATNDVEKPAAAEIDVIKTMVGLITTLNTTMVITGWMIAHAAPSAVCL